MNVPSPFSRPNSFSKNEITSFSIRICIPADLYVCMVLLRTAVSISAITAGNISPQTRRLKNHLLFVLGLKSAIFCNSEKISSIPVHCFEIFRAISLDKVFGDLYLRTGFSSRC
jgi:hypothetical protein